MEKRRKHNLNILWLSVAPNIRSGYGQVTKNIVFRLAKLGWPIIIVAYYGLHEGGMLKLGGVPILPIYNNERDYGKRAVPYYIEQFGIDLPILFCHDQDTEILTENGWKKFSALKSTDKVATLERDELRFEKPLRYFSYGYQGKMYSLELRNLSLCVTPNHKLYVRRRWENSFRKLTPDQIFGKEFLFKKDAIWKGEERSHFFLPTYRNLIKNRDSSYRFFQKEEKKIPMDLWLEFLGYFISEGSLNQWSVRISQSKRKNRRKYLIIARNIRKISSYIGCNFSLGDSDIILYSVQLRQYLKRLGKAGQKYIPRNLLGLSKRQLSILWNALMLGDGSIASNKITQIYASSSKRLIDDLQELLLKIGSAGDVRRKSKNFWTISRLKCLTPRKHHSLRPGQEAWKEYKGKVYSVQVPSGLVYVRRNGKAYWSGNSDFWRFDWFPKLENSTFYGPLDHSHYGLQHVKTLKRYHDFITISRWAKKEAKKYGRICKMFPHGVNTKIFKPMDKSLCRDHFNFREDKFIIGIVAANNDPEPRKGWDKMFMGLKILFENFPKLRRKIVVFAYTKPQDSRGFDLPGLAQSIGIEKNVFFPDRMTHLVGLPESEMAMLFNSFDLLMNCCHDKETKILSKDGLKKVDEINPGDSVWSLGKDKELKLTTIKRIFKNHYKGMMIHFKNKQFDLLVTPNHKIYYTTPKQQNQFKIREAKELLNKTRYYLPITGRWSGIDKEFIDKDDLVSIKLGTSSKRLPNRLHVDTLLSLIGWYISEGSLTKRKGCLSANLIRISNQNPKDKQEIISLFKKLGLNPILDKEGVICHSIELAKIFSECGKSAKTKRIPKWCLEFSKLHLLNLYNSLIKGDGSRKGNYSAQYYTSSNYLKDDFLILALKLGFSPHFWQRRIGKRLIDGKLLKPKVDWCISIREINNKGTLHKEDRYEEYYDDIVWCLETEEGNFFTERNGLIVMSGNSRREGFGLPIIEAQACETPVIGTNFSCYSQDTKILTPDGLMKFTEIKKGDLIWVLHNGKLELEPVLEKYLYDYEGKMIKIKNKEVDLLVTPNHRIYFKNSWSKNYQVKEAKEFLRNSSSIYYLPMTGEWEGDDSDSLIPDQKDLFTNSKRLPIKISYAIFMKLLGWYISEGSLEKDRCKEYNKIRFSNTHKSFQREIMEDLKKLGLNPRIKNGTFTGVQVYCIPLARLFKECGTHAKEKQIPIKYLFKSKRYLKLLFSSLMKGDGSKQSYKKYIVYTTSSERLKDDFVQLVLKLGYSPKIVSCKTSDLEIKGRKIKNSRGWKIFVRRRAKGTFRCSQVKEVPYQGKVWCLSTPSKNFFVEREGLIVNSGNSMPELIKGHGWLVKSKDWMYTPLLGKCAVPDQDDIAKTLEEAYFNKELRRKYGKLSRKFSLKYDWDLLIKKYWVPYLEKKEEELVEKGEEPKTLDIRLPRNWMKALV